MLKILSASVLIFAVGIIAAPIPLNDHSFRSFDNDKHPLLLTPQISELWDVHNITVQFSNRSYLYSKDTSMTKNRWLLHFADSINFHDIDFNFRIRLDYPEDRVKDAGWHSDDPRNDPGFIYDADRIAAYYTPNERFKFGFGKDRHNWGPLELGGLLVSDYNEGFTGFYQQYTLGGFVLRGLTAQLNSMTVGSEVMQRYFSAARLEYSKPNYGLAFGQSMLYAGAGRSWEMQFFFPFFIFHYGQMAYERGYYNAGQNSQGSMDGYYKIYKLPVEIYGELFVDDFQGHSDSISQSVQNTVSWMAGLRLKGADPWYGFIEGGKISTYSYNHKDAGKQLMHNRCFIATPLGPDQQLLWGKFGRRFLGDMLGADLNFWLRRSGEWSMRGETLQPYISLNNTRDDKQPFGIVEDELSFWTSVSYRKFFVDTELRGGTTMYRNRGNIESSKWESFPFAGIFLSSGLSVRAARD
ncbi:MAG: hypothetical protein FWE57_09045 [Chitinispirillia bacterium]|nr:hypothetical protein [Chitinispirillia bacterium]